jgi:hypothetical protein
MMAWTQTDLDRLSAAITAGVKSVTFADGRRTEYQTLREMIELRSTMKAELAASASQVNPIPRATRGRMRRR